MKCHIARILICLSLLLPASFDHGPILFAEARHGIPQVCDLPLDSSGFSVPPTPNAIYYISPSGNDSTGTGSISQPWATLGGATSNVQAKAQADTGKSDWFLAEKGANFALPFGTAGYAAVGQDCTHRMVFSSYDPAFPGVADPYDGMTIAGISCAGSGVVTVTTPTQAWGSTENIVVTKEKGYNGQFIGATVLSTTQVQYTLPSATCPGTSDTGVGNITLDRPVVEVPNGDQCMPKADANYGNYYAFIGIRCHEAEADPSNASFNPQSWLEGGANGYSNQVANVNGVLFEDDEFDYLTGSAIAFETGNYGPELSTFLTMRRNVIGEGAFGIYTGGVNYANFYENIEQFGGWSTTWDEPTSVTAASGTPGTFTWNGSGPLLFANNGSGNCSQVIFTTTGTMPGGINAGSLSGGSYQNIYYVISTGTGTFQVDQNSCTGSGATITSTGSSVSVIWIGSDNTNGNLGYDAAFPQPSEFLHAKYLQNAAGTHGTQNISIIGDTMAFPSGADCECQGYEFENLIVQAVIGMSGTKQGAIAQNLNFLTSYNGVFELAPYYLVPTPYNPDAWGLPLAPRAGTYTVDHNLIAYEANGTPTQDIGINWGSGANASYPDAQTIITNNVACGIHIPIQPTQGQPVSFNNSSLTGGSGYSKNTQINYYITANQDGIPLVSLTGSGFGFGAVIYVDGTSGVVVGAEQEYAQVGQLYKVGDLLSTNGNGQIGNAGSGWSIPVSQVQGNGTISNPGLGVAYTTAISSVNTNTLTFSTSDTLFTWLKVGMTVWDGYYGSNSFKYIPSGTTVTQINASTGVVTISNNLSTQYASGQQINFANGGSGYYAPAQRSMSGGHGTALAANITVNSAGQVIAVYAQGNYGFGYEANDVVGVVQTGGSGATVSIASVVTNVLSNNTYQAASCNNLQNGGDQLNYYQQPNSVAPPNTPSATPPTDVIGSYFTTSAATLAYGWSTTVPAVLTGYSSGAEQAFFKDQALMQKANWDNNLTAPAVLRWAFPQFGLPIPP